MKRIVPEICLTEEFFEDAEVGFVVELHKRLKTDTVRGSDGPSLEQFMVDALDGDETLQTIPSDGALSELTYDIVPTYYEVLTEGPQESNTLGSNAVVSFSDTTEMLSRSAPTTNEVNTPDYKAEESNERY